MDELLRDFLDESGAQLDAIAGQLARFERDPNDTRIVANIFLLIHAIKGACGFLDLPRLERLARSAEALAAQLRDGAAPDASAVAAIVTTVERIRVLLENVAGGRGEPPGDDGELIIELEKCAAAPRLARLAESPWLDGAFVPGPAPPERRREGARVSFAAIERLTSLSAELASIRDRLVEAGGEDLNPAMRDAMERLSAVSADFRSTVSTIRMTPADLLFALPRRIARDASRERDKKVEVLFEGGEVQLDRALIEFLGDPLAELVRNAVVHGIESSEERRRRGKPENGVVMVAIRADGAAVTIDVTDDGSGLDFAAIRERAFALGLGSPLGLAALSPAELAQFPLAHGFHAAGGAGLARVRTVLETWGGSITMESQPGRGVKARLRIAARSATAPVDVLDAGGARFDLPRRRVEDTAPGRATRAEGVSPDGSDVLAIDPAALAPSAASGKSGPSARFGGAELIVFRLGGPALRALPAEAITEIAEVRASQIEVTDGAPFVRLGDRRIALAGASRGFPGEMGPAPLLVLWRGEDSTGVIVDEIVDLDSEGVEVELGGPRPGVLGAARAIASEIDILDPIWLAHSDPVATSERGPAVLVLDRDPFFQGAITEALGRSGYEARSSDEESEALAVIAAEPRFAVAFVDLDLADSRGGELARRFQQAAAGRRPALIGLAAHGGPMIQARARRAGLSSAVGRFDHASMLAVLRAALPPREIAA
jgi:chemotaxis protein histidine kinase CheA